MVEARTKEWIIFVTELKSDHSISHIIAQIDVPYSNSMAEAANYYVKYYGLYHLHVSDFESLQKVLPQVVDEYNRRPNNVLDGLTPEEFLKGASQNFPNHLFIVCNYRVYNKLLVSSYSRNPLFIVYY